jgi:hypothetical protein
MGLDKIALAAFKKAKNNEANKIDKTSIVNNLTEGGETDVLSAEQGKVLDSRLSGLDTLEYEGVTYMVSKSIVNGHIVEHYEEVV